MLGFQQQPSFPFPCDQIVPGNDIRDPQNYPFPIPVAGPEAQQHLRLIAINFYSLLRAGINQGPISVFAYNLFTHNNFQNEAWLAVLADIYDLAVKFATVNPTVDHSKVLMHACTRYHGYAVANCLNHYPALQQYLAAQNLGMVQTALNVRNQIANEIQQLEIMVQNLQTRNQNNMLNGGLGSQPQVSIGSGASHGIMSGVGTFGGIVTDGSGGDGSWSNSTRRPSQLIAEKMQEQDIMETQTVVAPAREHVEEVQEIVEPVPGFRPLHGARERLRPAQEFNDIPEVSQPEAQQEVQTQSVLKVLDEPLPVQEEKPESSQYRETEELRPLTPPAGNAQLEERIVIIPTGLDKMPDDPMDLLGEADDTFRRSNLAIELGGFGKWLTDEGELAKVVSADNVGWATTAEQPCRTIYNPRKWHRMLVQQCTADHELIGPVYEGFTHIREGDPMDLVDLELDPLVREEYIRKIEGHKLFIPAAETVFEIEVKQEAAGALVSTATRESREGKLVTYNSSRGQRRDTTLACIELQAHALKGDRDTFGTAMTTEDGIKVRVAGKASGIKAVNPFTVESANAIIDELAVKIPGLAKYIDRFLTDEVNLMVLHGFGYGALVMESFRGDYADLLSELERLYGEEASYQFNEAVKGSLLAFCRVDVAEGYIAFYREAMAAFMHGTLESYGVQLLDSGLAIVKSSECGYLTDALVAASDNLRCGSSHIHVGFTNGEIWRIVPSIWDEYHLTFVKI